MRAVLSSVLAKPSNSISFSSDLIANAKSYVEFILPFASEKYGKFLVEKEIVMVLLITY